MRPAVIRRLTALGLCVALVLTARVEASAQSRQDEEHEGHEDDEPRVVVSEPSRRAARPARPAPAQAREPIGVRGFGLVGVNVFAATNSFEAVLGSRSGPIFGGGAQVTLPIGLYFEAAAWRFSADGERVFIGPGDEVFPLGIATTVRVTPLEITAGWRFRTISRRIVPYAGAGFDSYRYEETADFAEGGDDLDERFTGYHIVGGIEVRLYRLVHASGEVAWSSVPDAFGESGAAAEFGEDNLGGTSIRFKILVGR
ncbi:MAG: hypothetical protein ABR606_19515 [Vicinamibacterales bacterium]